MNFVRAALAVVLGLALGAASPEPKPAQVQGAAADLPYDPAVVRGVLANGLRYALMRNASPGGSVSARLAFDVGSLDESDAEQGVAHFVEHMAFRETRTFAEGELDRTFAPIGVAFGRDQNAGTSFDSTIYQLDLPDGSPERRALAYRWLRDVADGVRFTPAAVDRERGVVLAERGARNDPGAVVSEAVARFQGPELRTYRRLPIGDLKVLQGLDAARLKAFYDRWYRPANAVLVVVGDAPVETLRAEIEAAFGDWTATGPEPARAALPGPDLKRGLDTFAIAAPSTPTLVSACRITPGGERGRTLQDMRRLVMRQIWVTILNTRFAQLRYSAPSVLAAGVNVSEGLAEMTTTCIYAGPTGEDWKPALAAVQQELRRFEAEGPSETELESALATLRSMYATRVSQASSRTSSTLADTLAQHELRRLIVLDPREIVRFYNRAVEGLEAQDVREAFARDWSGAGPLISVSAPTPPTREAVKTAWADAAAARLDATIQAATPTWAYGGFGPDGKVVSRQVMADPDFVRLRFENGVVLNFKQTAFSKGSAELWVDFGRGRRDTGARSLMESELAASLFLSGGLGRHSYGELEAMLGSRALQFQLMMSDWSFTLTGTAASGELALKMLLIAHYLQDPGFRDDLDAKLPSTIDAIYRAQGATPDAVLTEALVRRIAPGGPLVTPSRDVLAAIGSRDVAALLRPIVTAAPLEVTIVGDVDEATAVSITARSFGALPTRQPQAPIAYDRYLRFPASPPPVIKAAHKGPADQAAVGVIWPLYVASIERRREEYAIQILTKLFDDELRHAVRERLGKAYAPRVAMNSPDDSDQGFLMATIETAPADVAVVEAETRAVAKRLARGGIPERAFAAAREPMLAQARQQMTDNEWWAGHLNRSAAEPQLLRDLVERPKIIAALTLDDVKQAAARWLNAPPLVAQALPETRP